jgi:hypothetical protein
MSNNTDPHIYYYEDSDEVEITTGDGCQHNGYFRGIATFVAMIERNPKFKQLLLKRLLGGNKK